MSLRARLLLLVAGVVLGAAVASIIAVRFVAESRFRSFVYDSDRARALLLAPVMAELYDEQKSWRDVQQLIASMPMARGMMMMREGGRPGSRWARTALPAAGERIVMVDSGGLVVVDSASELLGNRFDAARSADGVPVASGSGGAGSLFVGTMIEAGLAPADRAFIASIARAIVIATSLAALAALAIGVLVAGRLTGPLRELTHAAEATAGGNLDVRVAVRGGGEIARLASAYNRMADSLRELEQGRRRMIADSAHELRTPASLIQGTVEAMLDGVYPSDRSTLEGLHEEALRLSRLVEELGELSLLEAGKLVLDREPCDLAALARAEADRFLAKAREAGVNLGATSEPGLPPIVVDAARIGQVIANLLSNAILHTPRGGRVEVAVGRNPHGLALRVDDSGPGIPEAERTRVFERYYRLDGSRSTAAGGRGLGLAIAAGIVRAHGGTIRADASTLGGARFIVTLPAGGAAMGSAHS